MPTPLLATLLVFLALACPVRAQPPNVLLIAVDDLNDWVGCLGGHPRARTPNIDRLAARGVLFANAHCQSPVCNPSRASMMTSLYPATTGIYFLNPDLGESAVARKSVTMTMRFVAEEYEVAGAGKIFHGSQNASYVPNYAGNMGGFGPKPDEKLTAFPGHPLWDWGVFPERDEQMPDSRLADWGAEWLARKHTRPFFLAIGFYRPHVPQYAPQKWFDLHPPDGAQLPAVTAGDLDDLSPYAVNLTRVKHVAPTHEWVLESGEWKSLVRSYLACVSFVDAQVGRVLDALDAGPHAGSTYVVLYSDHGLHLGEKERWAKRSLWEEATRVPLIIAGPGVERGAVCRKPVELIDIYPTLLALTGSEPDSAHEGQSLMPLLQDPAAAWPHVARTSFGPGNVAIRSEHYRYIRYADGSEEFYDHRVDPNEWTNRIADPGYGRIIAEHRAHVPTGFHALLGQGSTGHQALEAAEALSR
jgi:arylsulfatase A-like enzyme